MIEKFFVEQGRKKVELDRYLFKELDKAGFTKSEIVKTPLVTRIVVNVTRPGLAIGKSGSNISQLTETIGRRFKIDNPQLEIKEITNPNLDAKAVCNKMRATIERGFAWRSVIFKTLNDIKYAGAIGIEIIVSGKITGKAGRKRKQRYFYGYVKKIGEQARLVDYAKTTAYPKVGAIGIKVRIIRPDTKFPDKVKIKDYITAYKKEHEAADAGEAKEATEAVADVAEGKEPATAETPKAAVAEEKKATEAIPSLTRGEDRVLPSEEHARKAEKHKPKADVKKKAEKPEEAKPGANAESGKEQAGKAEVAK
ncbi:30S ribosomal protein S3 [uncultured archaeon]|nr:30S ribosomal protein S3 [uncultured archaeon]